MLNIRSVPDASRRARNDVRRSRSKVAALLAGLLIVTVAPVASAGEATLKPKDVTTSATGQELRAEAAGRFRNEGVEVDEGTLKVWELGQGEYMVGESLAAALAADDHEFSFPVGSPKDDGQADLVSPTDVMLAAAPSWSLSSSGCFARISTSRGWLDSCYRLYKMLNDGNANKTYWSLRHWATCAPVDWRYRAFDCWLAARRSGGGVQAWEDWDPRSDRNVGGCTSVQIGVDVVAVLSFTATQCELWDITKYAEAGRFQNKWSCGCIAPFGATGEREVAYMIEVSVPQGQGASWTLSAGFTIA